jgi:hypothetical protein
MRWGVDANDRLTIGSSTTFAGINFDAVTGGTYVFKVNGTTEYTFSSTTLDMSTNILSFGASPATAGDMRTPSVFTWNALNAAGNANVNVISKIDSGNTLQFGDGSNNATTNVAAATSVNISAAGTTILKLQTSSPQIQLPGAGLDPTIQPLASATAAAGVKLTVKGQNRTASTGTSTGGANEDFGGDATGAGATHNGGRRASVAGSATGASGTRNGGDHWLGPGTGATKVGNMYFGKTDPVSFNYQAMEGGMAIENMTTAPTGNPTGAYYLYVDTGALKGRGTSGTVTTIGPAEPHCHRCGSDFAHEWESEKFGHLAVCISCLVGALAKHGVPEKEWVITRKAA